VHELKGEKVTEEVETSVDLNINAYIDSEFIKDESQKIEIYKKIAAIKTQGDMYEIEEEIEDRFGDIPEPLRNLLKIAYIRSLASETGAVSINQKGDSINIHFSERGGLKPEAIVKLMEKYNKVVTFNDTKVPYIAVKSGGLKIPDALKLLKDILEDANNS
jgi:transcription-repair coupling factor (superfamily II helicase)